MAKVKPSIIGYSGKVGRVIHYTRFGKTYSRQLPAEYNDRKSKAQLQQRALFKARQKASALFGTILQRGLTKEAHNKGMTEANYFSRLNKQHFVYENGAVCINYPALLVASGPLPEIHTTGLLADGLHIEFTFMPNAADKARPDDVVHIYAVEPQVAICMLMASVERHTAQASFDLPDLRDEVEDNDPVAFYLYAIVESASTADIPTLNATEKLQHKTHRNINRRVSQSVYVGKVTVDERNQIA